MKTNGHREARGQPPPRASGVFSPSHWASRFRITQLTEPSMWILPSCYVVGALVLGILTPRLDRRLSISTSFLPEPDNARTILSGSAPPPRHAAVRKELERLDTTVAETFRSGDDRLIASRPDPQGLGPSR